MSHRCSLLDLADSVPVCARHRHLTASQGQLHIAEASAFIVRDMRHVSLSASLRSNGERQFRVRENGGSTSAFDLIGRIKIGHSIVPQVVSAPSSVAQSGRFLATGRTNRSDLWRVLRATVFRTLRRPLAKSFRAAVVRYHMRVKTAGGPSGNSRHRR